MVIPSLPSNPAHLRYDFSGSQPWIVGLAVVCDRCGFKKTLGLSDLTPTDMTGLQVAYHFVYRDGSAPGWGYGVFVCPGCDKWLFLQHELPVNY